MVDNGLGITLLPQLAVDAGILDGTDTVVRPIAGEPQLRQIGLVWRPRSGPDRELRLLADFLGNAHRPAPVRDAPVQGHPIPEGTAPGSGGGVWCCRDQGR